MSDSTDSDHGLDRDGDRADCAERRVKEAGNIDRAENEGAVAGERQPVLFESLLKVGNARHLAWRLMLVMRP